MPVVRWKFTDPVTLDVYTVPLNPNDEGTPPRVKNILYQNTSAPDGRVLMFEGRDEVREAEVSGVILEQAHLDALTTWYNKRNLVTLEDDLGREFLIYITAFEPRRRRSALYPWKHEYTLRYTIIE